MISLGLSHRLLTGIFVAIATVYLHHVTVSLKAIFHSWWHCCNPMKYSNWNLLEVKENTSAHVECETREELRATLLALTVSLLLFLYIKQLNAMQHLHSIDRIVIPDWECSCVIPIWLPSTLPLFKYPKLSTFVALYL